MSNSFDFRIKSRCESSTVANIFIHGYSAGHSDDDKQKLLGCIPESLGGYTNIFAFWDSSHITHLDPDISLLIGGAARLHWAACLGVVAVDRGKHFRKIRKRSEDMGAELFEQLGKYLHEKHPAINTINLIGHSLGGRLIVNSFNNLTGEQPLEINNVLLMAAAVEVGPKEAEKMKKIINGRLINAYSKADRVLHLNVGENCIGRNTFEFFENIEISGFGHTDYWPKLSEVLDKTFSKQENSMVVRQDNITGFSEEGFWEKLKKSASNAGQEVVEKALQLYYLAQESNTPLMAKTTIYGALGYFIMPLDVIPDVMPGIGFTDDLGILVAAVSAVSMHINEEVRQKATRKKSEWFG